MYLFKLNLIWLLGEYKSLYWLSTWWTQRLHELFARCIRSLYWLPELLPTFFPKALSEVVWDQSANAVLEFAICQSHKNILALHNTNGACGFPFGKQFLFIVLLQGV